ncbi:ABC transporter permease [Nocardiopsis sp. TSRI0078]|uniref:ABC transporter permease n=1 Tax=unclassified Nocardiopsis TaxID=2649073 RepID=UPI00093A5DB8|nr:ABC transporter permease [Nocardiopsis sp. TSRI0078]OKI22968.1 ABC transporter permease [Nocardiopsis sp. TSRI0078]
MTTSTRHPAPAAPVADRVPGPARALADLAAAASAEWVKLRSVRSTWWGTAAALALMAAVAPSAAVATISNMQNDLVASADVPASEMAAYATLWVVQFAVIALSLPVITSEYSSRSIHPTLQAVPARARMLAAKTLSLTAFVFGAGLVLATIGTLLSYLVMLHPVFEGYGVLDPGEAVADAVRQSAYLAAVAVLTLGVGTALRSAAATLTTVFMLIMGLPLMLLLLGNEIGVYLADRLPFAAGVSFVDSAFVMGQSPDALSPAAGGMVLMCWTAAALAAGTLVLLRRDA